MMKYGIALLICFIAPEILPCHGNDSMQRLPRLKFRNYKSILEDVMDSIRVFLGQNFASREEDLLMDLVTSIEEENNYRLFWAEESKSHPPSYGRRNVVDDRKEKGKKTKFGGKTTKIPKVYHHSAVKNDHSLRHPRHSLRVASSKLIHPNDDSPTTQSSDSPTTKPRNYASGQNDSLHHPRHHLRVASSKLIHPNDDSPTTQSSDSPTKPITERRKKRRNYASGQTKTANKGDSNDAVSSIFKGSLFFKLGTIVSKPPEAKDTGPTQLNFFKPTKDKEKVASPPKTGVDNEDDPWKTYVYYALVLLYFCGMIVLGIRIMRPKKKETTITLRKGCSKKPKKDYGPGDQRMTITLYEYYCKSGCPNEKPKKDGDSESQHYLDESLPSCKILGLSTPVDERSDARPKTTTVGPPSTKQASKTNPLSVFI